MKLYMAATKYQKGRVKEYWIMHREKALGRIAFRTAGSHSNYDVISIDHKTKQIFLIQSKRTENMPMDYIKPALKKKLIKDNEYIEGDYKVIFKAE